MDGYLTDTQLRTAITAVGTHRATAGLPRLRSSPARAVRIVLGLPPTRKFMLKLKSVCPGGRVDFDAVSCSVRVRAAVLSTPTVAMWQPHSSLRESRRSSLQIHCAWKTSTSCSALLLAWT